MGNNNKEIESKFYIQNLAKIETILKKLGAKNLVPRAFEYNLRFDNLEHSLQNQRKVLRLRRFDDIRLTYKGAAERLGNALSRTEIELVVADFDVAQQFLEGLGYQVVAIYEKYRAMYQFQDALVTLDELPYGNFVEIEADSSEQISEIAIQLGLDPKTAIPASYQGLFEQVRAAMNLPVNNLVFSEFETIHLSACDLGVQPADRIE